jgi:2'-5' RNA ligase
MASEAPLGLEGRRAYVVLDLPDPVGSQLRDIRLRYSELRARYPAEITVAGSGGVGPIAGGQDDDELRDALAAIAASTPPITASFGAVRRFPSSNLFYLSIDDPRPFHALHERLRTSGIRFDAVPHEYVPHCTISGVPLADEQVVAIHEERIDGPFTLRSLSLFSEPLPIQLHVRFPLGTGTP